MKIILLSIVNLISTLAFHNKIPRFNIIKSSIHLNLKKNARHQILGESDDGSPSSNNYEYISPISENAEKTLPLGGFVKTNTTITSNIILPFRRSLGVFTDNELYNNTKNVISSLPGVMVGIPLNILTSYYTYQHYGYDIMTFNIVLLQFLIGFYTYGSDKYYDAMEYERKPFKTEKIDIYDNLIKNKYYYNDLYNVLFYLIIVTLFDLNTNIFNSINCLILYESAKWSIKFGGNLFNPLTIAPFTMFSTILLVAMNELNIIQYLPFILLLDSTNSYIQLKKQYGLLKPFYVSLMWVTSILILPCVIHDNDYSILKSPVDYISPFFIMFPLTNLADIKDIEEDKQNNIETIPVKYGAFNTYIISMGCLILYFVGLHH